MSRSTLVVAALAALVCTPERPRYLGIAADLPTGSPAISADGLVTAYDFETYSDDGNLRDFGPNGVHGVVLHTESTTGPIGGARVFREVADRVDLPEHRVFDLDGPLTVATWLRVNTLDLHQHVFACDDKFALWVTPRNQFRLGDTQGNGYSTSEGSVTPGTWTSVVAVLHATRTDSLTDQNIEIFVNGLPTDGTADPTWSSTVLHPSDACHIGFESHQGNQRHQTLQFEGDLDELLVFSRALTPAEVQAHATR